MKRILRANNFDVDIQMRSCEVLRREMRAALRSAPIPQAQINIKGEPAPYVWSRVSSSNINAACGIPGSVARPEYNYKQ